MSERSSRRWLIRLRPLVSVLGVVLWIATHGLLSRVVAAGHASGSSPYPNIVVIVADDLGYGDLGCYGASAIQTPHIDRLAAGGMRFTDAYAASSLCSPSRYSLLTGRYSWRTRLKSGVLKPFSPPLIEERRVTLASLLQRRGYFTAAVGKWHLGFEWALKADAPADAGKSVFDAWGTVAQDHIDFAQRVGGGPVDRGFDYFYGIPGSNNMIPFVFIENDRVVAPPSIPNDVGPKTLRAADWDVRHLDERLASKAVGVIDGHFTQRTGTPLFLYFAASAVHVPCLPSETAGKSKAGLRGDMAVQFDNMVGKVVEALARHGALDNTLIIVTSDNGPQPGDPYRAVEGFKAKSFRDGAGELPAYFADWAPEYQGVSGQAEGWLTYGHRSASRFSGFKGDAWEGGLRVPFICHWPDHIPAGVVNDDIICATDIMATAAEISGGRSAEIGEDSYSFLANLSGGTRPARRSVTLVAGRSGALVVRQGEWKYIEAADESLRAATAAYPPPPNGRPEGPDAFEQQLYSLRRDPAEQNNLAADAPEKVTALRAVIQKVKDHGRTESY